jgi:Tol biopolymer transport system component
LWTGGDSNGKLVFEIGNAGDHDIVVKDFATGKVERLVEGAGAAYSRTGHLIYQTSPLSGGLWALPFSKRDMRAVGEPFPVAQRAGGASVSNDGTLVYRDVDEVGGTQLSWYDREGRRLESFGRRHFLLIRPELSPDARRVAVQSRDRGFDVWITDVELGTNTRLTRAPEVNGGDGVWSPRSDEVAFRSGAGGEQILTIRAADGSREGRPLKGAAADSVYDWSPDGRLLAYRGGDGIWMADPSGASDPFPFLQGGFAFSSAQFSPDGRYIAYCSRETGELEVYITSFPGREARRVVSTGGGTQPRWSRDGKELFYVTSERDLMAVPVSLSPELSVGRAKRLFRLPALPGTQWQYDVHPDGRRFLLVEPSNAGDLERKPLAIHVVENWFEEFRGREKN